MKIAADMLLKLFSVRLFVTRHVCDTQDAKIVLVDLSDRNCMSHIPMQKIHAQYGYLREVRQKFFCTE